MDPCTSSRFKTLFAASLLCFTGLLIASLFFFYRSSPSATGMVGQPLELSTTPEVITLGPTDTRVIVSVINKSREQHLVTYLDDPCEHLAYEIWTPAGFFYSQNY